MALEFMLLGPLEVRQGEHIVALGGAKQRALLALLLLHANEVVSRDRLIDELWGERSTPSAGHRLETHISRLRKALGLGEQLITRPGGYVLKVDPMQIDAYRFERLLEEGRRHAAADKPGDAAETLRAALALWRGNALADLSYQTFARSEIERLEELRLDATEERIDIDLLFGRDQRLVSELERLAAKNPLRERLRGQLMLALYRSGRQAEALEAYQKFRRAVSEQLGLDPGPGLRQLELAILRRDPTLDLPASTAASQPPRAASPALADSAAPVRRRHRRWLVVGGTALVALALLGAIVAAIGGSNASPEVLAGDSVGVISPSGGAIQAVVPLGTSPSALAAGKGAVWIANYNDGTILRVDVAERAVVQTIQVGTTPSGVAVGAGAVWITNNYGQTVSRINPAVNRVVQTIAVGNAPTGVAAGGGAVWVANSSDGTLTRINAVTGAVTDTIALGGNPTGVAAGAGAVWVSDEVDGRVLRVDPHSDQVTASMQVGTGPIAITVGFGSVWVANTLDGTVSRIDPATNSVRATIPVGDGAGAITAGGGGVWVASPYAGTVSRIDPGTDTVGRTIAVGNRPQALAIAGGAVWVGAGAAAMRHRGGTLKVVTQGSADTFDPVLTQNVAGLIPLTNDGLTAYQHVGGSGSVQVVPDLAVSLPSPTDGGTTYTFELRRGIRYSNGELVRPEDFRRALERDLILGPNPLYGDPFAEVVGGAACASHPSHCDLSRGVVTDDAANTVTFHLVAPNPEFLARLTLPDGVAVPVGAPGHNIGLHPLPATGPYEWARISSRSGGTLVRNPRFHEWSHAAQPGAYPDQIAVRHVSGPAAELTAVERGSADLALDGVPPGSLNELNVRFASQLYANPATVTDAVILNTRVVPFSNLQVRQAINYAIDRGKIAGLLGEHAQPTCQVLPPHIRGYRRYCPYTANPSPSGVWRAPNLAEADHLIAASHTRGTPITIWNLGGYNTDYPSVGPYLVSLLDRLGYPTTVKSLLFDPTALSRFADSRTKAQAALSVIGPLYPSAAQVIQVNFGCQSFVPDSTGNANLSEFCDHSLDSEIARALAAESNDSPNAATLWAQADQTVTNQAPFVALTTPTNIDFVSARVGNYQYSNAGLPVLLDQLWVR